jgi:predicted amidohydrolase
MLLDRLKEKLFQRYLVWLFRPARLRRFLKGELPCNIAPMVADKRKIRVAALQVKLELYKNPLHYAARAHERVKEAHRLGAQIVVFPEYNSLPLFGLLPGVDQMDNGLNTPNSSAEKPAISPADIFNFMTPAVMPFIDTLFSRLASAYGIYIMAGSYPLADGKDLVNRSFLYGPGGKLLGSQDKVHLLPMEVEWKMKKGNCFRHFNTGFGTLAMPVCMDATYFETFRLLEADGVDIALLPIANLEEYNYWLALRGIWPRVQESALYGVKSALVGNAAGFTFTGKAGIFAPLELTSDHSGVLAETENPCGDAIAVADLNLEALQDLRSEHPWRDKNPAILKTLNEAYRLL